MTRLPVRWRITLAFAGALAAVLLAVGAVVYLRYEAELTRALDAGLESRAAEVAALRRSGARLVASADEEERFALVTDSAGRVLDATPGAARIRLTGAELRRAAAGAVFLERRGATIEREAARLVAVPAVDEIAVAGVALDDRDESLAALLGLMAAGLGVALALASGAGYWVAGIAQRLTRLERTRAAERAAVARERRFVADASHELRTPLTVLKSELDVALQRERGVEELRAALVSAREEADGLVALAEDLLMLARADEGAFWVAREPVDVAALLAAVARRRGGGDVRIHAANGLTVGGDRGSLERAVGNLLDNALVHGAAPVDVTATDGDGTVRIAVRDHGPGFPPGFADRAFERFARPDAGRGGGGTGLGLAIVDAIARAHGGRAVASAADPGARVEIVLPASSSPHPRAGR
jgi:two-component system, OmpR family, sensor kinase